MPETEITRQTVIDALYAAIDELNETLAPKERVEKSCGTTLFGEGSRLDSLGFVNLILATEQRLSTALQRPLALSEKLLSEAEMPPAQLEAFATHIQTLLENRSDG